MKKLIALFLVTIFLSGCVSLTKKYVDRGDFPGLFYLSIYSFGKDLPSTEEVSKIIKSEIKGDYKKVFYEKTVEYIKNHQHDEAFFYVMRKYIDQSKKFEILTEDQCSEIENRVVEILASKAIYNKSLESNMGIMSIYPKYQAMANKTLDHELKRAFNGEAKNFSEYAALIDKIPLQDTNKRSALAEGAVNYLKSQPIKISAPIANDDLKLLLKLREIPGADKKIDEYISSVYITRKQLKDIVFNTSKELFAKEEARRDLPVNFTTDDNSYFFDEVTQRVFTLDDWIRFDKTSKYNIKINRINFQENLSNPVVQSQHITPSDPATFLYIPKNASVIFDYKVQKINFQWSLNASHYTQVPASLNSLA